MVPQKNFYAFTLVFALIMSSQVKAGEKIKKNYLGKAPMYQMIQSGAKANIIFFNGGPGWWGNLRSKNFLIRERESFFSKGLNVFLFPNKKKKYKMTYDDRLEDDHIDRIRKLVQDIRTQNDLPVFLAGISRGAVSVGKFISQYGNEVDGAVLLSGIYYNTEITKRNAYSMQEVIGSSVPTNVLVVHHEEDCCKVCDPASARQFYEELKIKNKVLNIVSGGGSSGSCHGPFHHHGFEGVEQIVVEGVVSWVTSKIK